jgi:hypothetical protein
MFFHPVSAFDVFRRGGATSDFGGCWGLRTFEFPDKFFHLFWCLWRAFVGTVEDLIYGSLVAQVAKIGEEG